MALGLENILAFHVTARFITTLKKIAYAFLISPMRATCISKIMRPQWSANDCDTD